MYYPAHPFLTCFFERTPDRIDLEMFAEDAQKIGLSRINSSSKIPTFEAAIAVSHALEVEFEDWTTETQFVNETPTDRIANLRAELASENALKGPVAHALDDPEFPCAMFEPKGRCDLYCLLDDGKSWQAHMFLSQRIEIPEPNQIAGDVTRKDIVKSDSVNYLHVFQGNVEKPRSYEDDSQQQYSAPKRLEMSWSYLEFHNVPKDDGSDFANMSGYIFAEQYFGATRELPL